MKKLILLSALFLLITGCASTEPKPDNVYQVIVYDEHSMIILKEDIRIRGEKPPGVFIRGNVIEIPGDKHIITSNRNTVLIEKVGSGQTLLPLDN